MGEGDANAGNEAAQDITMEDAPATEALKESAAAAAAESKPQQQQGGGGGGKKKKKGKK